LPAAPGGALAEAPLDDTSYIGRPPGRFKSLRGAPESE